MQASVPLPSFAVFIDYFNLIKVGEICKLSTQALPKHVEVLGIKSYTASELDAQLEAIKAKKLKGRTKTTNVDELFLLAIKRDYLYGAAGRDKLYSIGFNNKHKITTLASAARALEYGYSLF